MSGDADLSAYPSNEAPKSGNFSEDRRIEALRATGRYEGKSRQKLDGESAKVARAAV